MPKTKKETAPHFEEAMNQLSTLVERLDKGGLTLEDSLAQFEQGIQLVRQCQGLLTKVEQKVEILLQKEQELTSYESETEQ